MLSFVFMSKDAQRFFSIGAVHPLWLWTVKSIIKRTVGSLTILTKREAWTRLKCFIPISTLTQSGEIKRPIIPLYRIVAYTVWRVQNQRGSLSCFYKQWLTFSSVRLKLPTGSVSLLLFLFNKKSIPVTRIRTEMLFNIYKAIEWLNNSNFICNNMRSLFGHSLQMVGFNNASIGLLHLLNLYLWIL